MKTLTKEHFNSTKVQFGDAYEHIVLDEREISIPLRYNLEVSLFFVHSFFRLYFNSTKVQFGAH